MRTLFSLLMTLTLALFMGACGRPDMEELMADSVDSVAIEEEDAPLLNIDDTVHIVISKQDFRLTVYNPKGDTVVCFPVALSRNYGNKRSRGDCRTPEGEFTILRVNDATHAPYALPNGRVVYGVYGPWFLALSCPGIGIHGTSSPLSIGTRASHGCIRMRNWDVSILAELVKPGCKVTILPGEKDKAENAKHKDEDAKIRARQAERAKKLEEKQRLLDEKRKAIEAKRRHEKKLKTPFKKDAKWEKRRKERRLERRD